MISLCILNTKYGPLKCMSLHYQQCVDNMALTSAEDGSFAEMRAVLPQGRQQGPRLRRPGQAQGLQRERPARPGPEP